MVLAQNNVMMISLRMLTMVKPVLSPVRPYLEIGPGVGSLVKVQHRRSFAPKSRTSPLRFCKAMAAPLRMPNSMRELPFNLALVCLLHIQPLPCFALSRGKVQFGPGHYDLTLS